MRPPLIETHLIDATANFLCFRCACPRHEPGAILLVIEADDPVVNGNRQVGEGKFIELGDWQAFDCTAQTVAEQSCYAALKWRDAGNNVGSRIQEDLEFPEQIALPADMSVEVFT